MTKKKNVTVYKNGGVVFSGSINLSSIHHEIILHNALCVDPFLNLEEIEDGISAGKTEVTIKNQPYKIVYESID